jgi:hypothetical protein
LQQQSRRRVESRELVLLYWSIGRDASESA